MNFITKSVLIFLSINFAAANSFAQEDANTNTTSAGTTASSPDRFLRRIIFEGSLLNAGYEGSGTERYSKENGYAVGILFDLIGTHNWVFETGASYRHLGTDVNNGLGNNSLTANYISIPVSAKFYFSGQEGSSFYLKAGAMGSVLISNNTIYATPTTQVGPNAWETALLVGIGYKMQIASAADLIIEANYTRSINSVFSNDDIYRSDIGAAIGVAVNL